MKSKLTGIVIIILNLYWMFHHARYLYLYQTPDILWYSIYPTWYLISNIILGLVGLAIGVLVFQEKMKINKGIFFTITIFSIELAIDLIYNL